MNPMKTTMQRLLAAALACAAATVLAQGAGRAASNDPLVIGEVVARDRCAVCHGPCGQSVAPNFPRLAGQNAQYLLNQLQAFARGERKDTAMQEKVKGLSATELEAVAEYYARQKPGNTPSGDELLLAVGRYIYERGNRHSGLAPCATCHGPQALGTAELPRLAGQHPAYIQRQVLAFRERDGARDNPIMRVMAHRLSDLELEAVAAYLGNLK
ncbi:c-type cytochrome [Tepidimonas charontis]|uniref:Cytochrome c4 n=1 Tax=Tepidimonas charontis TaxID=2267262 RepID=A0A554XJA3_9BURK|nr:c-type cytochrome [Tepidimonas charontis]TSE35901.1 Cytochrome c4 [Tepidimonas charontis]